MMAKYKSHIKYTPPKSRYGADKKEDAKKYEEEINQKAKSIPSFSEKEKKEFIELVLEYYSCCKYNWTITNKNDKNPQNFFLEMEAILYKKLPKFIDEFDPHVVGRSGKIKEFIEYLNCHLYYDTKMVISEYRNSSISSGIRVSRKDLSAFSTLKKYAESKGLDLQDSSKHKQIAEALGISLKKVKKVIDAEKMANLATLSSNNAGEDNGNFDAFENLPDIGPSPEEMVSNAESFDDIAVVAKIIIEKYSNTTTQSKILSQKLTQLFAIYAPDKITASVRDGKFFEFDNVLADNIIKAREDIELKEMAKDEKDLCKKLEEQFPDKSLAKSIGTSAQYFSMTWSRFEEACNMKEVKERFYNE